MKKGFAQVVWDEFMTRWVHCYICRWSQQLRMQFHVSWQCNLVLPLQLDMWLHVYHVALLSFNACRCSSDRYTIAIFNYYSSLIWQYKHTHTVSYFPAHIFQPCHSSFVCVYVLYGCTTVVLLCIWVWHTRNIASQAIWQPRHFIQQQSCKQIWRRTTWVLEVRTLSPCSLLMGSGTEVLPSIEPFCSEQSAI